MANRSKPQSSTDTIRSGRRSPRFVQTPEWIVVAGLSPQAQALYTALLAHVNHQRDDGLAWPGMNTLAELLGFKHRRSIARYTRELVTLGAVEVERRTESIDRRNIYVIHELPPTSYAGPKSLAEFYAARKATSANRPPRDTTVPTGRGTPVPVARDTGGDMNKTNTTRQNEPDESTSSGACAAGGPRASAPTDKVDQTERRPKIFVPRDFQRWTDNGRVMQFLVKAAVASLQDTGMELHTDAADRLGYAIKTTLEDKPELKRSELVRLMEGTIALAGSDDQTWGWLAA